MGSTRARDVLLAGTGAAVALGLVVYLLAAAPGDGADRPARAGPSGAGGPAAAPGSATDRAPAVGFPPGGSAAGRPGRPGIPPWAPLAGTASLFGTVCDAGGRPVAGAVVRAIQGPSGPPRAGAAERVTGGDGRFAFAAPAGPGTYALRVDPPAGERARLTARIVPVRSGFPVRIVLGSGGAIEGLCRDERGKPVRARVAAEGDDWAGETRTDAEGRFRLEGVAPGLVLLRADPERVGGAAGRAAIAEAAVTAGRVARVEVVIAAGSTVAGDVRLPGGAAVEGAQVKLESRGLAPGEVLDARTGPDGRFAIAGVPPGEARLYALAAAGSAGPVAVEVPDGGDAPPANLVILSDASLSGTVRDVAGRPVGPAVVGLWPENQALLPIVSGAPGFPAPALVGADGRFAYPAVLPGSWRLSASAPGFGPVEQPVVVEAGRAVELDLVLPPGARLVIEVRLPDGGPAPHALVVVEVGDRERRGATDAGGRYEIDDLPPGPAAIRASMPATGETGAFCELTAGAVTRVAIALARATTLRGSVHDVLGGPVPGASVRIVAPDGVDRSVLCDEHGRFEAASLGAGPFLVEAHAPGFGTATLDGVAPESDVRLLLGALDPVEGEVVGPDGERVFQFVVEGPGEEPPRSFEGGRFFLSVPAGAGEIVVRAPGLVPARVALPEGGGPLRVRLEAGAEASGVVLGADGRPLPGAAILRGEAREEDLLGEASFVDVLGMTEGEGDFHVQGVPPEGLVVTVSHPDHAPLRTVLAPRAGQRIALAPGARIVGRVLGPDGAGVAGVGIVATGPVVRRAESGDDGAFEIGGLAAGEYRLDRLDAGEEASGERVRVAPGATVTVMLRPPGPP